MKCKSVACIWSGSPPVQRVTATAFLHQPPTLYTGGSDGSIIWWNLVTSIHKSEMKPVALLCGHAAPIADLGICIPDEDSSGELTNSSSMILNPNSIYRHSLISACTDGVLCVWSRESGHCKRRRKIPPWAGSPFMIKSLPGKMRYVCITCSINQGHQLLSSEDRESRNVNPSKCAVIIMDSHTLTIVQTVFHGSATLGPLKSMALVFPTDNMEKQSVMIVDSFGKVLYLPIFKEADPKWQNVPVAPKDLSISEELEWLDDSKENGLLVAFAKCRHVLALVYRTHCTFRLAHDGTVFGKIPFADDQLCLGDNLYVIGGIFLGDDSGISNNGILEEFMVWNNRGRAFIYRISYSGNNFMYELLYKIPAVLHSTDMRLSFSFIPFNRFLLRVESLCYHVNKYVFWKPCVTIWLMPQENDNYGDTHVECKMVGEGSLFDNWAADSFLPETEGPIHDACEDEILPQSNTISPGNADDDRIYGTYQGGQIVSSSLVISEDHLAPYAIVYGLFSGDIEIIKFDTFFPALDALIQRPGEDADSHGKKQHLSGHSGAVLCLASHQMVSKSEGCTASHVLLSGSMDCTIRVWDTDSGNPITVLHQHVAPVRQIILAPRQSEYPWSDCFLTVGDDSCVSLASLQTLRVERLFPGHLYFPEKVVWDGVRGYIACLCPHHSEKTDALDILYIWDVKTGARERILRGAAAHSMFDQFLVVLNESFTCGNLANVNTSASSLVFPVMEGSKISESNSKSSQEIFLRSSREGAVEPNTSKPGAQSGFQASVVFQSDKHPIKSSCPYPGVSTLCFDLTSLMSLCSNNEFIDDSHIEPNIDVNGAGTSIPEDDVHKRQNAPLEELGTGMLSARHMNGKSRLVSSGSSIVSPEQWVRSIEGSLLKFSLSFLHLWNVDNELDNLLITEMKLKRPSCFIVSSGMLGDRGAMTVTFPGSASTLELWRSSAEYSAMRSLTMVSLAQHLISLSHSCSSASSALAAFYTRKFASKVSDVKPPLLQLLVSFWQNEFEHVKMAARSLFHCAASRAIPYPLGCSKPNQHVNVHIYPYGEHEKEHQNVAAVWLNPDGSKEPQGDCPEGESEIISWLESYEMQDWISCVGGTTQDAMCSQIMVAAALAAWYPSLVKQKLPMVVVHPLIKLVMSTNEKYSAAAAEILAEGMESTWRACIGSEIPRLIGDIFFQVECVSGKSASASARNSASSLNIWESLVRILLPSLAMADIPGFLHVIEHQVWFTASDSPVHVVSLMTLIRVVRGSSRNLAPYLDKVVTFILLTMDPGNLTMRKTCIQSSRKAIDEVIRAFPMVALNDTSTRLAVGDAIAPVNSAIIRVYDMQSMSKIKVLDASGPLGLPSLLGGTSDMAIVTAISALSFSPDGEGLVAFSENGLMIRWWSLGSVWWEKLSRNLVPVQCTKLIFVPPWEGFSPNSTRSSIMASVSQDEGPVNSPGNNKSSGDIDRLKLVIHNLDLSYRLEWVGERKVKLTHHSHELGTFLL